MKTLVSILSALVLGTSMTRAAATDLTPEASSAVLYGNPFIFEESGITFSVYPDGEFDFYLNDRVNVGADVRIGNAAITFNSGYNYDPYVQYDDYGAVIQIENIPIYYDYYGRVNQIGDIPIYYRNGRVHRIGGLYAYYNSYGAFTHCTGYVNLYNRHYVYRPYYRYFARPAVGFCLVFNHPYRRYYRPARYTYYHPYAHNYRKSYARVGHSYTYKSSPERDRIYRNDKRVAVREPAVRSNRNTPVRKEAVYANRRSTASNSGTPGRAKGQRRSYSNDKAQRTPTQRRSAVGSSRTIERKSAARTSAPKAVSRERSVTQRTASSNRGDSKVTRTTTRVSRSSSPARSQRSATSRTVVKRETRSAPKRSAATSRSAKDRSASRRSH